MIEYYLEIRTLHITAVILSGLLFCARWVGLIANHHWPRTATVKYLSYAIDTLLVTAALMLMTIIHQYPFAQAWLTVKVLLLILYIYLGIRSFRINQTSNKRVLYGFLALCVYGYIISVARAHHPLGIFVLLQHGYL